MAGHPPSTRVNGTPTMELVFVERVAADTGRVMLILHQKFVREDKTFYFREIRRITSEKLERLNRIGNGDEPPVEG